MSALVTSNAIWYVMRGSGVVSLLLLTGVVGLGALSLDLVVALIVSSLIRSHLSPRLWRGVHWLAYAAWPLALAHGVGMGSDNGTIWLQAIAAACVGAVLALVGWRQGERARGPKRLERRPVPRLAEDLQ